MARIVLLDAGPLGLLPLADRHGPGQECRNWLARLDEAGAEVRVADVTVYEVRRELKRRGASAQIRGLDGFLAGIARVPIPAETWEAAEDLWAVARRAGRPTAPDEDLDADALLAAVALAVAAIGDRVTIATTNAGHFARFPGVVAGEWREIR